MNISSKERLHPFSHRPGTKVLVPGTTRVVEAFPALLRVDGEEIPLPASGRVFGFTVMQDLDRRCVFVYSREYRVRLDSEAISGDVVHALKQVPQFDGGVEKLFCGCHKKQEWEGIKRRRDMREILPILHRLAQMMPLTWKEHRGGMFDVEDMLDLFDAGFEGIMVPRLFDSEYQGIVEGKSPSVSPMALFPEVARRIRALFIDEEAMRILPALPKELHAGRYVGADVGDLIFDIEWSKKRIRRMVVSVKGEGEKTLRFQSGIKRFRLRCGKRDRGITVTVGSPVFFEQGKRYFLDRFEK